MLGIANIIEEGKRGGPQVRMVLVAAALKGRAETVIVMPRQNSASFRALCEEHGVTYRILSLTRITKELRVALGYIVFFPAEVLMLARLFRREKVDLVHVSGGSWQYKGVIAGRLAGKKVLWHLNDTSMPGLIRRMFAFVSPLADGFIFASERSKAYYRPLMKAGQDEYVIPAAVDTAQFDPQRDYPGEEVLLERWRGKFVIGTVANINPIKGLETFIGAAASLNRAMDDVLFVVIGAVYPAQQRYYESLKELCEKLDVSNIEFVGMRSDVRALLKRFDVYVCSSHAESSPISVWEAMSMAKPIVSTDVGDVPLYVQDGLNGFIADVKNSEALAERLNWLARDESLRKAFGDRCREIVVQELDVLHCAERHIEAYNAILAKRS